MTLSRKYFSAPTLTRALLDAARHHSVEPEAIIYRVIDKKTGFVKAPRGVLIEVDPDRPIGDAGAGGEDGTPIPQAEAPAPGPEIEDGLGREIEEGETDDRAETASPPTPEGERRLQPELADVGSSPELEEAIDDETELAGELLPEAPVEIEPEPASAALTAATKEAEAEVEVSVAEMPETPIEPEIEPASPALAAATEEAVPDEAESRPQAAAATAAVETRAADPELEEKVAQAVDELAHFAGLRVQASAITESEDGIEVELDGPDGKRLTAHDGRALLAMQHLLPRLLFHELGRASHCRIDCEGFQAARVEHFAKIASKAAQRVREAGRPWILEPMAPDERRLVHIALADEEDLVTESIGEGFLKRVRVSLETAADRRD